ncbi:unnamed protein product [Heterobilharzia americana]|nr:unnamed protein product [Heterobilharzia americana]
MIERWSSKCSDIHIVFKVEETVNWIKSNKFTKVGLQFPDELLGISVVICRQLNTLTDSLCVILGDSSFASCCVDEISGQHIEVNAVVHYGQACLSENTRRIPVFYVFGKYSPCIPAEIQSFEQILHNLIEKIQSYSEDTSFLVITYDFRFKDIADRFYKELILMCDSIGIKSLHLIWSEPYFSTSDTRIQAISDGNNNTNKFIRCGRLFIPFQSELTITSNINEHSWNMLYIGHMTANNSDLLPLYRILLSLPEVNPSKTHIFDPITCNLDVSGIQVNRLLKRRSYLIERAKDAQCIGILVCTLSVKSYQNIIDRLKQLLKRAGRSYITLIVGKLNEAKLANIPELQLFILVACPETSLLDSHDFHIPIITPFEMECALRSCSITEKLLNRIDERTWTAEKLWLDFCDLLPGGRAYVPIEDVIPQLTESLADVSLVNGHSRLIPANISDNNHQEACSGSDSLVVVQPSGDLIQSSHWNIANNQITRTWYGLDPKIGQTTVAHIKDGRTGLPTQYTHEHEVNSLD